MSSELIIVLIGFFLVAVVYSAAGFGGGSSYLAILCLIPSLGFGTIRTTALICNVVVVTGSLITWSKKNKWDKEWLKKNTSILIVSIPLAYLAGGYKINQTQFFLLLGITLVIGSVFLFFMSYKPKEMERVKLKKHGFLDGVMGGTLGGLAGLVGIGGGIFLSPYLYLTNWDTARKISVATSLFIFFNSTAGLAGQLINRSFTLNWNWIIPLSTVVFIGGQLGIRTNMSLIKEAVIKKLTAILILLAGINVLIRELW